MKRRSGRERDGLLHVFAVTPNLIARFDGDRASIIANFARLDRSKQAALLGARDEGELGSRVGSYWPAMRELCSLVGRENPRFGDYVDIRELLGVFVIEPQHSLERLKAQSGAFLASALHERFELAEVQDRAGSGPGLESGRACRFIPTMKCWCLPMPSAAFWLIWRCWTLPKKNCFQDWIRPLSTCECPR